MAHTTHIEEPWISFIFSGKKKYECRAFDRERLNYKIGDSIGIVNKKHKRVEFVITELIRARSFLELFEKIGLENTLPGVETVEEGVQIYRQWVSEERERQFGVVAIGLCLK